MFRFSCFHAHIHNHKTKKIGQPSTETMHKTLQDLSRGKVPQHSPQSKTLTQSLVMTGNDDQVTNNAYHMAAVIEDARSINQTCRLKKSYSLGSMPYGEGSAAVDNDTDDGIDQGFACDSSQHRLQISDNGKEQEISITDRFKDAHEGSENFSSLLFREGVGDPRKHTPHSTQVIVKSCSMSNIHDTSSPVSGGDSPYRSSLPQSRSSEDLQLFDARHREMSLHEIEVQENGCQSRDDSVPGTQKTNFQNFLDDGNDSYPIVVDGCITPVTDEINPKENLQGEPMVEHFDEFSSNDFKIKRIEDWVSDLQLCSPLDETAEVSQSADEVKKDSDIVIGSSAGRMDVKVIAGMEAAKRYISSLNAAATTAQLANYGLVMIPFLSVFVSLKVLNLSGNAIGKITAGALPRGLHMLNLSKNNISTIEGLRELTRLRLLDLSYNRIIRIGHGLASCSSLKELYLAGNKISEVEGLHRLLKLSVLDLRFNKISTTKNLGQLAANYNSLQAISLEGNPAQKNVGDEQLKKQLQSLLPHLAYYNRQPMKGTSLKDGDRSVRLGDHGVRQDHKSTRKMAHGSAAQRPSSSSSHGHRSQGLVSPRRSKLRQGHLSALPPKVNANTRHHHFDISHKPLEFKSDTFIRRSRSEGTLANL